MTAAVNGRDNSLSLLWRIADEALDPGYAAAAGSSRGSQSWRSAVLAVTLLLLGALIAAAAVQTWRGAPAADRTRADLANRVDVASQRLDEATAQISQMAVDVSDLRGQALSGSQTDRLLRDQLAGLEAATGLVAVSGPGLVVELSDGQPSSTAGGPDLAKVLDRDLQIVTNALFAAGAEAVSVNGQRLTTLSAIRGAGGAVLLGYRPLSPPYVITAIGDEAVLEERFNASAAADEMRTLAGAYGIGFTTESSDHVEVPAASELSLRYAHAHSQEQEQSGSNQ